MRKIEHLYIIGNGFDQFHGLPTSYGNFRDFVKEHDAELIELIDKYYFHMPTRDFWSDFEDNLGSFDEDLLREYGLNYLEDYGCEKWSDAYHHNYQYELETVIDRIIIGLRKCFVDWLAQISVDSISNKLLELETDAFYLTFNYTDTLEKIYKIPANNILHIHGKYNGEETDDIIYGHGGHVFIIDKDIEDPRYAEGERIIKYYYDKTTKPIKQIMHRHQKFFFKMITDVRYITIIGHSMNKIDNPYYNRICNSIHYNVEWTYYYHSLEDIRNCINTLSYRIKPELDRIRILPYPIYK